MEGTVIKSTGSWYLVKGDDGTSIACRILGKFRLDGVPLTNPVAVGDHVVFEEASDQTGLISEILPRKNYIARQSPRKKHNVQLIVTNIDQAFLIVTIREPDLKPGFIDRFLLMTEPQNIPVYIIFNKCDLYRDEDLAIYDYLGPVYTSAGYKTHLCSATEKTNLETLRDLLQSKITLIFGQSGVGKSTLINAIDPGLGLKTTELSDYTGKGQHTTTFAEMFELKDGGYIVDTPGIKTLSFNTLEVMDVAHNFREFFRLSPNCKYPNCTHRDEPRCAVKDAIERGEISELRYSNYLQILSEIEEQNYWERLKDY